MDEDTQKALNEEAEEINSHAESPTVEQTPEEPIDSEFAETTPAQVKEEIGETEGEPKKGFQSRIREVVKERNEEREKRISLEQKLAELTGQVDQGANMPQYSPQVAEGQEITPDQYKQDVMRQADSLVTIRLKQSEAVNRINSEAKDAIRAFPQLDPESESFDKELSESVTEAVEAHVRANPYSASVKGFVTKLMKPYLRSVTKEVGKVTENIAKQVSETALRPTTVRKQEKTAAEKSIAELEAELGIVQA